MRVLLYPYNNDLYSLSNIKLEKIKTGIKLIWKALTSVDIHVHRSVDLKKTFSFSLPFRDAQLVGAWDQDSTGNRFHWWFEIRRWRSRGELKRKRLQNTCKKQKNFDLSQHLAYTASWTTSKREKAEGRSADKASILVKKSLRIKWVRISPMVRVVMNGF